MASANAITVVEVCRVTPFCQSSPDLANEVFLPLTFFDIMSLSMPTAHSIFYYKYTELTSIMFHSMILPKLKHTLSLTLLHFLPLAGNLIWPLHGDAKPFILYTPKDGVSLTVAESNADFDLLSSNQMQDVAESYPYTTKLLATDDKVSILALQITLFPNKGFSLGSAFNHAALDGKSVAMFRKAWSHIHKHNLVSVPAELKPSFDRRVIQDQESNDIMECLKNWSRIRRTSLDPKETTQETVNSVRAKFDFSRQDIRRLRKKVLSQFDKVISDRKDTKPIHFSTSVLAYAYSLVCMVKAKGLKGDDKIDILFPVDCRARLDCPIPTNYFGNCVLGFSTILEVEALMEDDGVTFVARKLSEMIKGLEKGITLERAKEKAAEYMSRKPTGLIVIFLAGSPRLGLYGIDFGWGKPEKMELTSIDRGIGISMTENKNRNGGVEVGLVLKKHEMKMFKTLFVRGFLQSRC